MEKFSPEEIKFINDELNTDSLLIISSQELEQFMIENGFDSQEDAIKHFLIIKCEDDPKWAKQNSIKIGKSEIWVGFNDEKSDQKNYWFDVSQSKKKDKWKYKGGILVTNYYDWFQQHDSDNSNLNQNDDVEALTIENDNSGFEDDDGTQDKQYEQFVTNQNNLNTDLYTNEEVDCVNSADCINTESTQIDQVNVENNQIDNNDIQIADNDYSESDIEYATKADFLYNNLNEFFDEVFCANAFHNGVIQDYECYKKESRKLLKYNKVDYYDNASLFREPSSYSNITIEGIENIDKDKYIPYPGGPLNRPPVPFDLWRLIKDKKIKP